VRRRQPAGKLYTFYETIAPGFGGQRVQECEWLDQTARGESNLYTVYRVLTQRFGNSSTWQANINGREKSVRFMPFDAAPRSVAGGEIGNEQAPPRIHPDGNVYGCYGCTATPKGMWGWQRTTVAGSSQWQNINSATNITQAIFGDSKTDGRWVVGSLPGPFSVSHECSDEQPTGC
jgi:hypothetical protein